jgi:hypothetical protein
LPERQLSKAEAFAGGRADRRGTVRAKTATHADSLQLAANAKRPFVGDACACPQNAVMTFKLIGVLRTAMLGEIRRSTAGYDAQRLQSARRQGFVDVIADPDGDIQTIRKEVNLFVGRLQFDLDVRIEL